MHLRSYGQLDVMWHMWHRIEAAFGSNLNKLKDSFNFQNFFFFALIVNSGV
uniref:Uncharacterized protein n=1 Tax=Setaria italica TaxID=4555 RepID=K4AN81_SETIT